MKSKFLKSANKIKFVNLGLFALSFFFCQILLAQSSSPKLYKELVNSKIINKLTLQELTFISNKNVKVEDIRNGGAKTSIINLRNFLRDDNEEKVIKIPHIEEMEDQISSMYIPQGAYVVAYEHRGYEGARWTFSSGYYPDLWKSNDKISSMKIFKNEHDPQNATGIPENAAILYESANPASADSWNRSHGLTPHEKYNSEWNNFNSIDVEDSFKYLYVKGAYSVTLYEHPNQTGTEETFIDENRGKGTWYNLDAYGLRDKVSSAKVEGGRYECYDIVLGEATDIPLTGKNQDDIRSISVAAVNGTQHDAEFPSSVSNSIESSLDISRENSTEVSASSTVTVGTGDGASIATSYELSVTMGVAHAISNGETKGTAKQNVMDAGFNPTVGPGCRGATVLVSKPIKKVYKEAKLMYREIRDGKPVRNGHEFSETISITVDGATKVEFEALTFCEDDVKNVMLNNNWAPYGNSNQNLAGKFTESGPDNLIWTDASGKSVTLVPNLRQMRYEAKNTQEKFEFGIKAGQLDYIRFGENKLLKTDKEIMVEGPNTSSNNGGGDLTAKGGVEELLLTKTFKLQNATNGYHEGAFTKLSNGNLEWKNKAGVKWPLKPMYAANYLDTTVGNCPYKTDANGKQFVLIMENGQLKGFKFMTESYLIN